MKALPVIGKHELIHLYKEDIFDIPAKIDTGADKCSIWVSSVEEKSGVLSFKFFGPGSKLYTNNIYETTEYTTTPVRNSFGVTEIRYMVKLNIKLGEKYYKVRFTLADRSKNRFPVLLGMNFLKSRFWVNVAENYIQSPTRKNDNKNVLIVSAQQNDKRDDYFNRLSVIHKTPVHYDTLALDQIVYWFGDKPKVTRGIDGPDLKDYKLAYFKSYKKAYEQGVALAEYLHHENVRVIDDEVLKSISTSKLSEMMRLNCSSVPVPAGVAMTTELMKKHFSFIKKEFGAPFVLKDVYSEKGKNNYLVSDKETFLKILEEAPAECYFVAQEFIPNDGFLRLLVMNKDIPMVIKRASHPHKNKLKAHLNKPAGGENATIIDKSKVSEACVVAMKASVVMARPLAGVDAIQDVRTKKWYILEANASPQLMGDAYEADKAKALAKYIEYELERY